MRHLFIALLALVTVASTVAEPAAAKFSFNGRVDPDANLYRRSYDTGFSATDDIRDRSSSRSSSSSSRFSFLRSRDDASGTTTARTTRTTRTSGRCPRNRSLLAIFGSPEVTTGDGGWTFPEELINGSCPISAGILKVRESGSSPFGSMDF